MKVVTDLIVSSMKFGSGWMISYEYRVQLSLVIAAD